MDGAMGKEEDVVEAVLTCQGDFHDPELQNQIERFKHKLKDLLLTDSRKLHVKKVEPWNSVKVTLTIPREAAERLRQYAQNGSEVLRQMGVLSVQVQGDSQIALTLVGGNNEQVVINTSSAPQIPSSSSMAVAAQQQVSKPLTEAAASLDNLASSPGPSSDEVTRKNIVDYLRQGPHLRQNAALIGSLMGAVGSVSSSSSPRLGMGQDIPTVSNPVTSNVGLKTHSHRPNNIANVGMAASHLQGSQVAKSVPFKTTGAFQPPVPRHPFSDGQSFDDSAMPSTGSPLLKHQTNSINSPITQPAAIHQLSAVPETNQRSLVSGLNNFNQLGHPVHHSGVNNPTFTSSSVAPSSSSSSNYFVDLPPPPPYPHGSSSVGSPRANKPGNASSPMLVNLLQTDPSVAAAGMASGNPNKPLTTGEPGLLESSPKKKRKRKLKATPSKPLSNELGSSQNNFLPSSVVPSTVDSNSNPISMAQTVVTADTLKPLSLKQDVSAAYDSLSGNNKVSVSVAQCYNVKDSQRGGFSLSEIQSNFNKSAIAARTKTSSHLEPSRQLSHQQADIFSPETAAGKIINPYTGQLEPRDLLMDPSLQGLKDTGISKKSAYSATQMLARRALELDEIAQKSVPQSSSALLENVHAAQYVSSTLNLYSVTSNTTAAASSVTSGEPSISKTTLSIKGSLTQPSIQTSSSLLCPSTQTITSISSCSESQPVLSKESCSVEVIGKSVGYGLSNGPLTSDNAGSQTNVTSSEARVLHLTGASSSSSDSVIYSNLKSNSSYSTNVQASLIHQIVDQRNQIKTSPVCVSHSPLSLSVSLDIPPAHTRLSSPVTTVDQSRPSVIDYPSYSHHRQAAIPNRDSKALSSTVTTSPSLLNSVPEKHIDSVSSTESPPETKVLLEGDENSDHTGLVTDSGPEQSATAVLIEHSRVKIENHDSGVGSSSERSDDTPSEPGDGEFRTGHPANESEDSATKGLLSHKLTDCKTELPLTSVSSSITVGYMINPSSDTCGKPSSANKVVVKRSFVEPVSSAESSGSNISQFYDAHCKSMEKQAGLMAVEQVSLTSKWSEKEGFDLSQHGSKIKENGPMIVKAMDNRTSPKLNGPSSQGSLHSMMAAMNELQTKNMRPSPKQGGINNKDHLTEEHQAKEAVMDKVNLIHHQQEDQKESSLSPLELQEMKGGEVTTDKSQSDGPTRLEGNSEQLFLDLEEMQMKMMGNGTAVMAAGGNSAEGKGGNITSIYSKRSSPVNVNMLNHIYTSGLPLPRRLTESVQRLVKPLPASEMNMSLSLPQSRAYNSKSPVSSNVGALSKAGPAILSSTNGPHHPARMANHSGARSPGASMPRLIPNDQHRLLSGGLDLAGLSSLQIPLGYGAESVTVRGGSNSVIGHMPPLCNFSLREDLPMRADPLSMNFHSSSNLLSDSQSYSNRMLSQSYPPFKTKDHLASVVQRNHDIQVNLNSSHSSDVVQHSFKDTKLDSFSLSNIQEKGNVQYAIRKSHSYVDKEESRLSNQLVGEETRINHSNKRTDSLEPHGLTFSSSSSSSASTFVHSNAPSPLMPVLQKGQEPPITPTFPSTMPSISSQPPLISLATTEISPLHEDAAEKPTVTTTLNRFQPVPCTKSASTSSLTTKISLENSKDNLEVPSVQAHVSKLPTLSPVVSYSPAPSVEDPAQFHVRSSLQSSQEESVNDKSDPPQLTRAQAFTPLTSVSPKANTSNYQPNRNIFDTVSVESATATTFSSLSPKSASMDSERKSTVKDDQGKACDSSYTVQNILESVVGLVDETVDKSLEPVNKKYGSKQHSSVIESLFVSDNSKLPKTQFLSVTPQSKTKTTISNSSESNSEKLQDKITPSELRTVPTSSNLYSSSVSTPVSVSTSAGPVTEKSTNQDISMPNSSTTSEVSKPQMTISLHSSSSTSSESRSALATNLGNGDTSSKSVTVPEATISVSPVKEPILETLASALKHQKEPPPQNSLSNSGHHSKTLEKSPTTQKPPMIPLTASDISKLEQTMTLQSRMVAVQSSMQIKSPMTDQLSCTSSELVDQGSSHNRITRKRKLNSSESESHDSDGNTPTKAATLKHASSSATNKKLSEDPLNHSEKINAKDTAGLVETGVAHAKAVVPNSTERGEIKKAHLEHKDTAAKISADLEKSQERRRHRSITSSSQSDDGQSHRSSSNESRDSTSPSQKDGRSNRPALATPDKDGRTHRSSGGTPTTGQQRETKFYHKAYPAPDKEAQSKENRSHRVPGHHSSEDARHTQVDWSEDHSGEDKDKMKVSGGKVLTPGEKFSSPDGKDDGQKKVQRVKRQFYAYVPEKSLDQTYFDTPILSGRTRSKNKPTEEETAATGGAPTPSVGDSQASTTGAHNSTSSTLTVAGQAVGHSRHTGDHGTSAASDTTGGKRPTRSVRTKDTSQEQNPNKRRKVQQQR